MPCDQCTDPARCENFGLCQLKKFPITREVRRLTFDEIDDVYEAPREHNSFQNQAEALLRKFCEVNGLTYATPATPCKPGTRCSRSIRGLGGCEAGRCEDGDGVRVPDAGQSKCEQRGGCFGGDCCLK